MHLIDDDLARVADCAICHDEAYVWPFDDGAGDEIELCADCADLCGFAGASEAARQANREAADMALLAASWESEQSRLDLFDDEPF